MTAGGQNARRLPLAPLLRAWALPPDADATAVLVKLQGGTGAYQYSQAKRLVETQGVTLAQADQLFVHHVSPHPAELWPHEWGTWGRTVDRPLLEDEVA